MRRPIIQIPANELTSFLDFIARRGYKPIQTSTNEWEVARLRHPESPFPIIVFRRADTFMTVAGGTHQILADFQNVKTNLRVIK